MKRCAGPCERTLPATAEFFYAEPGRKGGLRRECKECSKALSVAYRREIKVGGRPPKQRKTKHVCPRCTKEKPLNRRYFYISSRGPGGKLRYDRWCKECRKESRKEIYHQDPIGNAAEAKARRAERRATDPEFVEAERRRSQAHRDRVNADPEKLLLKRQNARMTARLRGEVKGTRRVIPADVRIEEEWVRRPVLQADSPYVDVAPVRDFLLRVAPEFAEGDERGWDRLARVVEMDEKQIRRIVSENQLIHLDLADRIFTRAGRPDLFAAHYGDV